MKSTPNGNTGYYLFSQELHILHHIEKKETFLIENSTENIELKDGHIQSEATLIPSCRKHISNTVKYK